jgi:OOP family OmpA-OmpF porin
MLDEKPDKLALDDAQSSQAASSENTNSDEFKKLRSLLLGDDYENVIKERLSKENIDRVSDVISEAFQQRNSQDDSLAKQMSPVIESAIDSSIKAHPERITNVIFPIIGPAVRKAVSSALSDLMQSLNHLLQQSLTARAAVWRYKAWRLGLPYGQYVLLQTIHYQVEQVFLIHRETSLLIQSASIQGIEYQDPDLVSSMLSAIADFANDSFNQESDSLNVMQFGDLSLIVETGPNAILAFAVRGVIHHSVTESITQLIEKIHQHYTTELINFDGETDKFLGCRDWLEEALVKKEKQHKPSKPWLAIVLVSILVSVGSWFVYLDWQSAEMVRSIVQQVNNEPGYQVTEQRYQNGILILNVLRSPLAIPNSRLREQYSNDTFKLVVTEKLATLDNPELFVPYLAQKYKANLETKKTANGTELLVTEQINRDNLQSLKEDDFVKNYFTLVEHESLNFIATPSEMQTSRTTLVNLAQEINSQYFYFESASTQLQQQSRINLTQNILKIRKILELQQSANATIMQISVTGYADAKGPRVTNQSLSSERAKLIESILRANQIDQSLTVSWGYGSSDLNTVPSELQRRARIEILYSLTKAISHDQ